MRLLLNFWRRPAAALFGALLLAAACGQGTEGTPDTPGGMPDNPGGSGSDNPPGTEAEAPGPWAPSRSLALDRFAMETAVGAALSEPYGAELSQSTLWGLSGDGVELRLEVQSWFDTAEAEMQCGAAAGSDAEATLALGTPVWTAASSDYLTQDASCVRVTVLRGAGPDLDGAAAVAAALVSTG